MRAAVKMIALLAIAGLIVFWWLTRPNRVDPAAFAGLTGDAGRGATVFWAGGCASCHVAPDAEDSDTPVLAGGYRIESPFGTFVAPNISPSPQGLAGWSVLDLANALQAGVGPSGQHLYPALPYTSYRRLTAQDVTDLHAFLLTLPPSDTLSQPHELAFPFTVRRGLGLWKAINLSTDWVLQDAPTPEIERGRYLVEALGHCAECHTPRDALGGLDRARWMQGAPNPSGKGTIPGIDPDTLDWSARDIAYYLESGFTPDYDSAGGEMAGVVRNFARLAAEDRAAVAAYLKALP